MDITQGIVLIYNDLNGAHILQIGGFQQGTLITRKVKCSTYNENKGFPTRNPYN